MNHPHYECTAHEIDINYICPSREASPKLLVMVLGIANYKCPPSLYILQMLITIYEKCIHNLNIHQVAATIYGSVTVTSFQATSVMVW